LWLVPVSRSDQGRQRAVVRDIRVHRMASPVHDRAIAALLADLTTAGFRHPETGHRFIYQLV